MHIQINRELERIITARVADGMNPDAGDVVREALYALVERDRLWREHTRGLDGKIQTAMDEMKRGEGITEAQLMQHIGQRKKTFFSGA